VRDFPQGVSSQFFPPEYSCSQCYAILAITYRLTPTEQHVAIYVIAGLEDGEISALLSKSLYTVKTHLKHILLRTGARTRTASAGLMQASIWAVAVEMHPRV